MEFLRASPFSAVLLLYFMLGFKRFLLKTCFSSPLSPSLQRVLDTLVSVSNSKMRIFLSKIQKNLLRVNYQNISEIRKNTVRDPLPLKQGLNPMKFGIVAVIMFHHTYPSRGEHLISRRRERRRTYGWLDAEGSVSGGGEYRKPTVLLIYANQQRQPKKAQRQKNLPQR